MCIYHIIKSRQDQNISHIDSLIRVPYNIIMHFIQEVL